MENREEKELIRAKVSTARQRGIGIYTLAVAVIVGIWCFRIKDDTTKVGCFIIAMVLLVIGYVLVRRDPDSLIITETRVIGRLSLTQKQVDLPLKQISAVSQISSSTLGVHTSSGVIKFHGLENRDELYGVLTKLIAQQQSSSAAPAAAQSTDADELAKYKSLLDSGAITQEEYDAKKKQILGL